MNINHLIELEKAAHNSGDIKQAAILGAFLDSREALEKLIEYAELIADGLRRGENEREASTPPEFMLIQLENYELKEFEQKITLAKGLLE